MARLPALIRGLALARGRELRGLEAALSNNFVVFALVLLGLQPRAGTFLPVLIALLLLIPLCAGPDLPAERLRLLPLTGADHLALRLAGLLLAPPLWVAGALLALGGAGQRWTALLVLAGALAVGVLGALGRRLLERQPSLDPFRWIPRFPGSLGGLVQKNLRELLQSLDIYLALILALLGAAFRFLAAAPDPDLGFGVALLVVLALSTGGQDLFAAEGRAGLERCRLLPVRGWRLLLAKDLPFLGAVLLLTLPLAPLPALAAAMAALAAGHSAGVATHPPQPRWRFTAGRSSSVGLLQFAALFAAASLCHRSSPLWLAPCAAALAGSLAWHGRRLD